MEADRASLAPGKWRSAMRLAGAKTPDAPAVRTFKCLTREYDKGSTDAYVRRAFSHSVIGACDVDMSLCKAP